jgi:hypothetical protein
VAGHGDAIARSLAKLLVSLQTGPSFRRVELREHAATGPGEEHREER